MKKYDVLIVGSGTAGCLSAITIASAGYRVGLIDRKNKKFIGQKICGDAVGKHHFDNIGLSYPRGEEKEGEMLGIKIFSPDLENVLKVEGPGLTGFMINRYLFGQRLLKDAVDAGATLIDSTHVFEPVIKNKFISGISAKNLRKGENIKLEAKLTIDASGYTACIRSKLPKVFGIDRIIEKKDTVVCYREIRKTRENIEDPSYCEIYLDQEVAPGGYYWIFPKNERKVNVGLGVASIRNFPNPKNQLITHILSRPSFSDSIVENGGGGIVPTRRPLDSFVGNGIVVIGDAACHVNPIHGGGIGPSMMAGKIAGELFLAASEKEDYRKESLWSVNVDFMCKYGGKQAGLDVFRTFLQSLTNDDLNFGIKYRLIEEKDILKVSLGEDVKIRITEGTRRIFRGLGRLDLIRRLYAMSKTLRNVRNAYIDYPRSPDGMPAWKEKIQSLFSEVNNI